jgi:hypothetical protein
MANKSVFAWDGVGDIIADHSFVNLVSYAKKWISIGQGEGRGSCMSEVIKERRKEG